MYIILSIIAFGLLISVHELGHFLVAKACGVRVNEFSIGMGPLLLKKQGKETLYSLRLLPFGGFCAMEGEDESSEDPRSFSAKRGWQRIAILCAGAVANFLLGVIFILCIAPQANFNEPIIVDFYEGCPYESEDGFQVGDRIYSVDGHRTFFTTNFSDYMSRSGSDVHRIVLIRDGKRVVLEDYSMPLVAYPNADGTTQLRYGIWFAPREFGLAANVRYAWYEALDFVRIVWDSLGALVSGAVGVKDLSGPVGIVDYVGEMASEAESAAEANFNFIYFFAVIAVNLAVMNLLPIPALDGGRVFAIFITAVLELIIGRKIDSKYEKYIHGAGFVLLMALMVFVLFNDVYRIIFNG